jgi:hypothetical protein
VINGSAFNLLADWVVEQASANSSYNLFSVLNQPSGKEYIADSTCSTMPWRAFGYLRGLGCDIASLVAPRRNLISYFVGKEAPEKVDMTVAAQAKLVANFFRHTQRNLVNMFFDPAFGRFQRDPQAYVYAGGEYWKLHLRHPYTALTYTEDLALL